MPAETFVETATAALKEFEDARAASRAYLNDPGEPGHLALEAGLAVLVRLRRADQRVQCCIDDHDARHADVRANELARERRATFELVKGGRDDG